MSTTTSPVIDTTPVETGASETRRGSTAPAPGRQEIVLTSGTYLSEVEKHSQPVGENAPSASHDSSPSGNSRSIARQPTYIVPETPAEYYFETGLLPAAAQKPFAAPLITHGVAANRKVLETIAQYSLEQGLTPKLTQLEDLYPPSMLNQ